MPIVKWRIPIIGRKSVHLYKPTVTIRGAIKFPNFSHCTNLVPVGNVNEVGWLEVRNNAYNSGVGQPRVVNNNAFNMPVLGQHSAPERNTYTAYTTGGIISVTHTTK